MPRAPRSGRKVTAADLPAIFGMVARGDRRHDVAAWLGLNQGRIKEAEDGVHGTAPLAPPNKLPPSGSPGPKAIAIRRAATQIHKLLKAGDIAAAIDRLEKAMNEFDVNE